jgi:transposase
MSDRLPRMFTTEYKERAVLRLEAGAQFSALATELGIRRKLLYEWRKAWRAQGLAGLNRKRGPKALLSVVEGPGDAARRVGVRRDSAKLGDPLVQAQARIAELERLVGRQQVDLDFFRKALRLTDADTSSPTARAFVRSSKP